MTWTMQHVWMISPTVSGVTISEWEPVLLAGDGPEPDWTVTGNDSWGEEGDIIMAERYREESGRLVRDTFSLAFGPCKRCDLLTETFGDNTMDDENCILCSGTRFAWHKPQYCGTEK